MSVVVWCWPCERTVVMLDEVEWLRMESLLRQDFEDIKQYRGDTGASHDETLRQPHGSAAPAEYRAFTGVEEIHVDAIRHHRRSLHGSECPASGKRLRTPRTRYCLRCHAEAVRAQKAG